MSIDLVAQDIEESVVSGVSYLLTDPAHCLPLLHEHVKRRHLTIITQNIRSLNRNYNDFLVLLTRFNMVFDMIILTECWLTTDSNLPSMPNYVCYATQKCLNQNSGVVVYIRNSLNAQVAEPDLDDANCLLVKIGSDFAILGIYRPPSFRNLDRFESSLDTLLQSIKLFPNIITLGDINIDIKPHSDDNRCSNYLNVVAMYGLIPSHHLPTRLNNCLDHCLIKTRLNSITIVCETTVTDHSCVLATLSNVNISSKHTGEIKTKLLYHAAMEEMALVDWSSVTSCCNATTATDIFISTVSSIINKHTVPCQISNRKRTHKPWITPGLLRCIRFRDRLHLKLKKYPHNLTLQTSYKRYRNTCNQILNKLKLKYERDLINKNKNNLKKTWEVIKDICHINKQRTTTHDLITIKPNPLESVNHINRYFSNIGQSLAHKLVSRTNSTLLKSCTSIPVNSIALLPVDHTEIENLILSLKTSTSTGWDGISSSFLKQCVGIVSNPIAHVCNLILTTGVFPKALKKSIIIPIHKSGSKQDISNYRPISLLPTLGKIAEKVINKQLVCYLDSFNHIAPNQYGFRKNISTADAINHVIGNITRKLDSSTKCLGVFLDLAKAFDTVSIPILLNKMERLGIRGTPLQLFSSYLSERTQFVKIGDYRSDDESLTFGVPQGSVLGPTLFLIYIDGLCRLQLSNTDIVTFADDTVLVFHGASWDEVKYSTELGLARVMDWLNFNILTLNLNKTKYVTFSIRNTTQPYSNFSLKAHSCSNPSSLSPCNCHLLEATNIVKYLGIYIDQNLTWIHHINSLSSRISKLIFIFKNIRHIGDPQLIKSVYFALCQSIISYGIEAWGGAKKSHLIKIERAQRAIIKVITFKNILYPTSSAYKEFDVLSVRQLFIKTVICRQHKYSSDARPHQRRRDIVYSIPTCKTKFAQSFPMFLGPYLYNRISKQVELQQCTINNCKRAVTTFLKNLNYEETESLLRIIS